MPRTGRPRVLDETKQREICALVSAGCGVREAARYVGCSRSTIHREAQRNPAFRERLDRAAVYAELSPLRAMQQAVNTHWRAAAWMLERGDPEHFARRPAPAFRPKQAQALRDDIAAILNVEIDNPILLRRVKKQIQHLIGYSIDGVVSVERTDRQLRAVLREIDELEREADERDQVAYDVAFQQPLKGPPASARYATSSTAKSHRSSERAAQSASGAPKSRPRNAEQHSPDIDDLPVSSDVMNKLLQRLQSGAMSANGTPATVPSANGKPTADPATVPPTR